MSIASASVGTAVGPLPSMSPVAPVSAVPMEEVHQRAGQQQQVGQNPEQVGAVLGKQIEQRDGGKYPPGPGYPSYRVLMLGVLMAILVAGSGGHSMFRHDRFQSKEALT